MIRSALRELKNLLFHKDNYAIKREINSLLSTQSPVIVEAGAHIGSDTLEMSRMWPKATIHAFEPVPRIYKELVSNTKGVKNIITYPIALGDKTGTADIFVSSGKSDASSSLLSPKDHKAEHPDVLFNDKVKINTITIDEWALANRIERIDFLWLDMQGYELAALKQGTRILGTVELIYTEVFLTELYSGAPLYDQVRTWLEGHGFRVQREALDWETAGNVIFVRK